MDLSEYALETLRIEGGVVLSRGRHRDPAASSTRSILLLATVSEHPPAATLKRLDHEYAFEGELRSAWAAQPVALTEHQGRIALVLEDPGGEPLDGLLRGPMELGLFLRLAVGLAYALRELHAQGIIHRDVKPANALADIATGRVWLMGFGIASRLRRERQGPEPPEILEVLDLNRDELQRNGISIRTQLATGKPLVRVDQLQQVVLNLILNAVDAMSEPGTSPRELSIASRREEANQVLVEVRDSGRGFQAETMERIFDPFFTTKIDGMGMGLSISRSIVVAHGGRLWAMANEPRRAVFQFALPTIASATSKRPS